MGKVASVFGKITKSVGNLTFRNQPPHNIVQQKKVKKFKAGAEASDKVQ